MAKAKKQQIFDQVPAIYRDMVSKLEDADTAILSKHMPHFNTHRDFANLVELGIDIAERRKEIALRKEQAEEQGTGEKISAYGKEIVRTFSAVLGIPDSTINHVARSVEIMGGGYLREIAEKATNSGIKLTYSHIREMNRLDSPDWKDERLKIVDKIFSGEIVTHREVTAVVDELLGVVRTTTVQHVVGDGGEAEARALAKVDKKAASNEDGDALGSLATGSDIEELCVELADLIGSSIKKFDKIETKLRDWREDVTIETLQSMPLDTLDAASVMADEFAAKIKDISLILDDALKVTVAACAEV